MSIAYITDIYVHSIQLTSNHSITSSILISLTMLLITCSFSSRCIEHVEYTTFLTFGKESAFFNITHWNEDSFFNLLSEYDLFSSSTEPSLPAIPTNNWQSFYLQSRGSTRSLNSQNVSLSCLLIHTLFTFSSK